MYALASFLFNLLVASDKECLFQVSTVLFATLLFENTSGGAESFTARTARPHPRSAFLLFMSATDNSPPVV